LLTCAASEAVALSLTITVSAFLAGGRADDFAVRAALLSCCLTCSHP